MSPLPSSTRIACFSGSLQRAVEGRTDDFVGLPELVVEHRGLQRAGKRLAKRERMLDQVALRRIGCAGNERHRNGRAR